MKFVQDVLLDLVAKNNLKLPLLEYARLVVIILLEELRDIVQVLAKDDVSDSLESRLNWVSTIEVLVVVLKIILAEPIVLVLILVKVSEIIVLVIILEVVLISLVEVEALIVRLIEVSLIKVALVVVALVVEEILILVLILESAPSLVVVVVSEIKLISGIIVLLLVVLIVLVLLVVVLSVLVLVLVLLLIVLSKAYGKITITCIVFLCLEGASTLLSTGLVGINLQSVVFKHCKVAFFLIKDLSVLFLNAKSSLGFPHF
jgi:hypothetical protein